MDSGKLKYLVLAAAVVVVLGMSFGQLHAAPSAPEQDQAAGCTVNDPCTTHSDCGYPPCYCNETAKKCRDGGDMETFRQIVEGGKK
jgi:hypothetical protein